jgi:galactose mutarotase-like enzyme
MRIGASLETVISVLEPPGKRGRIRDVASRISVDSSNRFQRVTLTNGLIELAVLPQIGGKMTSLRRTDGEREFLLQPPERPYGQPEYGACFRDYDTGGFDECLPTVAECEYPEGRFAGTLLPDHGELWSIPWQYELHENELWLAAAGRRLPYIFRKRIRLENETVVIAYELVSVSDEPFRYLWSAHPLLNVESGCRIVLPSDVSCLMIHSSHRNRLGAAGSECNWPSHEIGGREFDLSVMGSRLDRAVDKLFTNRLARGWCALHYPASDESIVYQFNAGVVPYLGMWLCQGGWPNEPAGHFTVALEPCTSRFDSVAEAIRKRECELLAPREKKYWELRMEVKQGPPVETISRDLA